MKLACTVFAIATFATSMGVPARADVIFSNFDETTEFTQAWGIVNPSMPTAEFQMAISFTVAGSDYLLDSVMLPILAHEGFSGPPQSGTSGYFSIYAAGANQPGDLLESTTVINDIPFFVPGTGQPWPSPTNILFSGSTTLKAGHTYWVGFVEAEGTALAWLSSPDIALTPYVGGPAGSTEWPAMGSAGLGLQIFGTPVPSSPTVALLGIAILGRTRRRVLFNGSSAQPT